MTETPETTSADTLAAFVKAAQSDRAFVTSCATEAAALVARVIGTSDAVPDEIKARAILEVGADLFHRRRTRNGLANLDGDDLTPVRVTRDPLKAAVDLLTPYLGPAIA